MPLTTWVRRLKYSPFKGSVVSVLLGPSGSDLPAGKKAKESQPHDWAPFGPIASDSRVRYDLRQDWGLIVWAPLVLIGLVQSFRLGRRQFRAGEAPTAAALILWAAITWVVVTVYLPMAWDRYLLPPQSVNALLAALALSAIYDRVVHHIPLSGRGLDGCAGFLTVRRLVSSSSCWRAMRSSGIRATGMCPAASCSHMRSSTEARSRSRDWTSRPGTRHSFMDSITPISCRDIRSWRPCLTSSPSGCLDSPIIRSIQSGCLPLLGGRLLDHPGHIRHLDRLDGGPPRDRGSRAGMSSMAGGIDWPGLWLVDTGLRLCDARLRPSGFGVRLVRLVLAFMEEGTDRASRRGSSPLACSQLTRA